MLKGDSSSISKAMKSVSKEAVSTVGSISKTFLGLTKTFVKVGGAITAALVGTFTLAIKKAADAEYAFAKVTTLFSESKGDLLGYRDAIREISDATGKSFADVSEGFYQTISAGFKSLEDSADIMKAASKAAIAGSTDMGTSVEAITRVLNAYSLSGKDAMHVGDALFTTVKQGVTTFGELAPRIGDVAGIAAKAGIGLEDLLATFATMSKFMPTAEAMTSLTAIISGFISPATQAKAAAMGLGTELSASALATKGLAGAIVEIANLSAEQQAELFPNIRALKGVFAAATEGGQALLEQGKGFKTMAGEMEAAAAKMEDTFSHQFGLFQNQMSNLISDIGDVFKPEMKAIVEWMNTSGAASIKGWIINLKEGFEEWREAFAEETKGATTKQKIEKAWGDLVTWAKKALLPKMYELGKDLGLKILEGLEWALGKAWDKIKEWGSSIFDDFFGSDKWGIEWNWNIFQHGGWVEADKAGGQQPVIAHDREFIMNPTSSAMFGPMLEMMNEMGLRGGSYHDVSTNIFNFGDKVNRRLVRDEIIPELAIAKRSGFGMAESW